MKSKKKSKQKEDVEKKINEEISLDNSEKSAIKEINIDFKDKYIRLYSEFENYRKRTAKEKIDIIKDDVRHIMETLGLDLTDDSLKGTPNRVAKMFVKEIFGGLDPDKKPSASTFENKYSLKRSTVVFTAAVSKTATGSPHCINWLPFCKRSLYLAIFPCFRNCRLFTFRSDFALAMRLSNFFSAFAIFFSNFSG